MKAKYRILVKFMGDWSVYATTETFKAAVKIRESLSWETKIVKIGETKMPAFGLFENGS